MSGFVLPGRHTVRCIDTLCFQEVAFQILSEIISVLVSTDRGGVSNIGCPCAKIFVPGVLTAALSVAGRSGYSVIKNYV